MPNEVFLSHSNRDRPFVRKLVDVLRRRGIPVWYSETNIQGAQQWHDEIGAALRRCDWFVLVLSPHAVESKWVKRELLYSLRRAQDTDSDILGGIEGELRYGLRLPVPVFLMQILETGHQFRSA